MYRKMDIIGDFKLKILYLRQLKTVLLPLSTLRIFKEINLIPGYKISFNKCQRIHVKQMFSDYSVIKFRKSDKIYLHLEIEKTDFK